MTPNELKHACRSMVDQTECEGHTPLRFQFGRDARQAWDQLGQQMEASGQLHPMKSTDPDFGKVQYLGLDIEFVPWQGVSLVIE